MAIHVVKQGDTLYSIANQYGTSTARILYDNQLSGQQQLVIGQALLIPEVKQVHTVARGETGESIAAAYGITVKQLYRNNPYLLNQQYLIQGENLVISYEGPKLGTLKVMGYAYPFISPFILREALLYIDELFIFSYGFTPEGELIPPQVDEEPLLQAAEAFQVVSILVLTPVDEQGRFNNLLVKEIAADEAAQENLIENLLQVLKERGYGGVDVDFESVLPEDRAAYGLFVQRLKLALNEQGYRVSVALAPKTSAAQTGIWYSGVDYQLLGRAANSVFLMTYEWGYTYGPPMAVAPLNKVREVLDYAVTEIPPEKIFMGIPNYGYDWPLPFQQGVTKAKVIGNTEAVQIAEERGAEIFFDETAVSPYFHYAADGVRHEVWFEDVRSIEAKVRTALEFGFQGIGYWNLMRPFRANWLLLNLLLNLG